MTHFGVTLLVFNTSNAVAGVFVNRYRRYVPGIPSAYRPGPRTA